MLGLIWLGALATAVNWRLSAREVTGLLKLMNAGARFPAILADADCEPLARDAVAGLGGVDFAEQLPRNATGKVLKAVLREPHWAGQDRRVS